MGIDFGAFAGGAARGFRAEQSIQQQAGLRKAQSGYYGAQTKSVQQQTNFKAAAAKAYQQLGDLMSSWRQRMSTPVATNPVGTPGAQPAANAAPGQPVVTAAPPQSQPTSAPLPAYRSGGLVRRLANGGPVTANAGQGGAGGNMPVMPAATTGASPQGLAPRVVQPQPQPQQNGPATPEQAVAFGSYMTPGLFRNPQFLNRAAHIFINSGNPQVAQQGIQWLNGAYKAQQENMLDALKLANAGDLRNAERVFNAGGQHAIQPGSLHWTGKPGQSELAGVDGKGQQFTMDPKAMLKSFLTPANYFAQQSREQQLATQKQYETGMLGEGEQRIQQQGQYEQGMLGQGEQRIKMMEPFYKAYADMRGAQADHYRTMLNSPATTDKLSNAFRASFKDMGMRDLATNRIPLMALSDQAAADTINYVKQHPNTSIADAQAMIGHEYQEATSALTNGVQGLLGKVGTDNNALRTGLQKLLEVGHISPQEALKYMPGTALTPDVRARVTSALRGLEGTTGVGKIWRPQTQAEYDKLPKNAEYVGKDGRLYRKQ